LVPEYYAECYSVGCREEDWRAICTVDFAVRFRNAILLLVFAVIYPSLLLRMLRLGAFTDSFTDAFTGAFTDAFTDAFTHAFTDAFTDAFTVEFTDAYASD
jgi:hypothetical protein